MEERIIDDEYGRGIRMKKTKDGYVDVTDAALEEGLAEEETEAVEELAFEFPDLEEDDEDLVGLTPEEALALRKKKEEEAALRAKTYAELLKVGEKLLSEKSFKAAELEYEKALSFDDVATEASVGYWRAKTENFEKPDVLIDEYLEAGYENLEFDLGYEAVEIIKKEHKESFEKRYAELTEEEKPLKAAFEERQEERRKVLKPRLKKARIAFFCALVPFTLCLILAIVFGLKNFTVLTNEYIPVTIVFAALSVVLFVLLGVFTNKYINSGRIYRANENPKATEEGERLLEIAEYKELYSYFVE
ncbi:MAG: hypothetical protein IJX81_07340 [Clostridia bacterium]|nr:hypothetical protein [Clostridia bacterium]